MSTVSTIYLDYNYPTLEELFMCRRVRLKKHIGSITYPAYAFQARSDWGLYKDCVNEQATLGGKKECSDEFLMTKDK